MRVLLAAILLCWSAAASAAEWIDALDIPLMPGLQLDADSETRFETAGERIVEIEARGAVAPDAVRRYYASALPGLGWQAESDAAMLRDGERLRLEISGRDGAAIVVFRLTPQ